jgi:transposase
MNKKYIVRLRGEERKHLEEVIAKGRAAAYRIKHAYILLKANEEVAAWADEHIAAAFNVHPNTVRNVRQRFVEQGLEGALGRKARERPPRAKILDGEKEARLLALSCSQPPKGRSRWTLHLLADKMVELRIVDGISHETVRQVLKKTN